MGAPYVSQESRAENVVTLAGAKSKNHSVENRRNSYLKSRGYC